MTETKEDRTWELPSFTPPGFPEPIEKSDWRVCGDYWESHGDNANAYCCRTYWRFMNTAKQYRTGTYLTRFVAPDFQKMIRAEAGAQPAGYAQAIIGGERSERYRDVGECVCVTSGRVLPWKGTNLLDTGHFLASRLNSIVLEENNVAPQSHADNFDGGKPEYFREWMLWQRGQEIIDELEFLKRRVIRKFTLDELVRLRLTYNARLKATGLA